MIRFETIVYNIVRKNLSRCAIFRQVTANHEANFQSVSSPMACITVIVPRQEIITI